MTLPANCTTSHHSASALLSPLRCLLAANAACGERNMAGGRMTAATRDGGRANKTTSESHDGARRGRAASGSAGERRGVTTSAMRSEEALRQERCPWPEVRVCVCVCVWLTQCGRECRKGDGRVAAVVHGAARHSNWRAPQSGLQPVTFPLLASAPQKNNELRSTALL